MACEWRSSVFDNGQLLGSGGRLRPRWVNNNKLPCCSVDSVDDTIRRNDRCH